MATISLVQVEAMSRNLANKFARTRFWDEKPIPKDQKDLERFIGALHGKKVLDVGCGYGMYGPDFVEAGLEYMGIDNSPEMIREARRDHPDLYFRIISMNQMMFLEESFDGIWACCSFSTTPKAIMQRSVGAMRRCLTQKGVLFAVVPNFGFSYDGLEENVEVPFWHSLYTPQEFRELFRLNGFQVEGFWEDNVHNAMSVLARK